MKPTIRKLLTAMLATMMCVARPGAAEDIDLFTSPPSSTATAPNILIVLDNSANWARNDQAWPVGKQGQAELYALRTILADNTTVNTGINLGLMMFGSGSPADGGYVRFHVRNMTPTNAAAFRELIGTDVDPNFGGVACGPPLTPANNSLNGTPNCILANFNSSTEKINSASTNYSGAMMDIFKYFGGYTDPAHANTDSSPNPPNVLGKTKFGPQKYSVLDSKMDPAAYSGGSSDPRYNSPINADGSNNCAKNYVIWIGNGYPSQDADPSLLTGIFGDATVPPPIGNKNNLAANWAKYINSTDVNSQLGRQNVTFYAIDVFNAHPDTYQTPLLQAIAKYGGSGERGYFQAKSQQAILDALKQIIVEIQSVNSVFASASLPINATNRTQNENQVFIGMFRPDPDALPRWYGNLKQYQIALFGTSAQLADSVGNVAVSATTGFIQACATSFWTTDSGPYWSFSAPSAGSCTSVANSSFSDLPDGGVVEKGGVSEVLRKGNGVGTAAPYTVNRTMLTCASAPCSSLIAFNSTNVTATQTGAASSSENTDIVNFTFGQDVNDENANGNKTEPRPSIHNDIIHSRPLPVNFGGSRGVELYYGSNDGAFRAVSGTNGKELWSFVAPEHLTKLKRLMKNTPLVAYPNLPAGLSPAPKDYFFDGSSGVYQNADNSKVWIFPSQRRGGRMVYGFDVSTPGTPVLKWARGCPNTTDDTGCSSGFTQIGLTFSTPQVAFIKGYHSGSDPVVIMGGGYDKCEDVDLAATTCTSSNKGNVVYILDAGTGAVLATFNTSRAVAADVTLVDRDFDGQVDAAYVLDIGGTLYRIDFTDPSTINPRGQGAWSMTKVAQTSGANRKFLFGPAALAAVDKTYLAFGSGDRERPLSSNYPYTTPVSNRFYMFIDSFPASGYIDLDGGTLQNFSAPTSCGTTLPNTANGWFMDLNSGRGEQTVTSSVIFGGAIFFSTNRPVASAPGTCSPNLGEARGYALNLINASGVIGSGATCGGARSGTFTGGGIPPSPVVGTVPVKQPDGTYKPTAILIGGIDLTTGGGSPIGAQKPPVPLKQTRQRLYWYPEGDK